MNRPEYETSQDLANQERLMKAIFPERHYHSLDRKYQLDYLILHPKLMPVWCEVKQRTVEWGTYDTYLISLAKYMMGKRLATETRGQFYLVTGWANGVIAAANLSLMTPITYPMAMGGRADRSDAADREPVILIPNASFKVIDSPTQTS
jgi:hypothetical protein